MSTTNITMMRLISTLYYSTLCYDDIFSMNQQDLSLPDVTRIRNLTALYLNHIFSVYQIAHVG